ncbi:hypothetical protein cyc_00419 [Cyclospora cayetanensis]|uniref:C3H1-type domain-containing protein n=1 Tax=Cyclospora cayetanensis TaxID=88456 RepID=A0A1D3D3F1_9EIME|nr:hypothetical protein cyc_00419 [Cyclospora cayetanensis]
MTAAALFPMTALASTNSSCFSSNSSTVPSRRHVKDAHLTQRLESSPTKDRMQEMPQQQWQEESSGAGSGIGSEQSFVKSEKMPTVSAASFLHFPAQQDSQRPLELLQRSQGVQGPPQTALRPPSLAAKTSSLLQRKQQFYKTKMCPWFSRGRCDRGTSCQFAHNAMELRATPDLRRTSLCPRLKQLGRCVNRDCSYAHQPQELRATGEVYKTALCVKWQLGRCAVGNLCRHALHNAIGWEQQQGRSVGTQSKGLSPQRHLPVTKAAAVIPAQDLHIDSQQQPLLVRDALLLQQQQPATLQLQDGLWQQQEQHCLHPLADDCCMTFERTALSPENANPRLQQQQQTKALAYGPHLPQQQQHASWDHEGLLCIWDQPDQQDVQGAGGDGVPRQQTQQLLDAHLRCSGGGIRATAAAAEAEAHLTPEEATRGGGETRPVPLEAPERSRISKTSEESPCSILFSGPQLFNVTVETE